MSLVERVIETPVMMTQRDLAGQSDDARFRHMFYKDEIDLLLEAKLIIGNRGVLDSVATLLTRSAVSIVHVDVTSPRQSYRPDEDRLVYNYTDAPVGFNDHFGGSESKYKILLNGSPDGDQATYVLYAPPDDTGNTLHTTFHRCNFTFLQKESEKVYRGSGHVPNPLKTSGANSYRGDNDGNYRYFLFGGSNAPSLVYQKFAEAGFDFIKTPYDGSHDSESPANYWNLRDLEDTANKALGYRGGHYWPGDQFEMQLTELGLSVPRLTQEEYPLVKPHNQRIETTK